MLFVPVDRESKMSVAIQRGIEREIFVACRTDGKPGLGTSENPFDVHTPDKFDKFARKLSPFIVIHLAPGLYFTRGYAEGWPDGWKVKAGQRFIGAGMGNTTVQIVENAQGDKTNPAVAFGCDYNAQAQYAEVSDLTIDCNLDGQPNPKSACGAVQIRGSHTRLNRVRAINFGMGNALECFVLTLGAGNPDSGPETDLRITDCIVEKPAVKPETQTEWGGITAIMIAGLGTDAIISGCRVDGGNLVNGLSISQIDNAVVERNLVRNAVTGFYNDTFSLPSLTIRDNIFQSVDYGIKLDYYNNPPETVRVGRLRIERNDIAAREMGIALFGYQKAPRPYTFGRVAIEGNDIEGSEGLRLFHCEKLIVRGNFVKATAPPAIALYEKIVSERNYDENLNPIPTVA